MVGDLGGILKPVGLYQHHLELGGGVDVYHLVAPALDPVAVIAHRLRLGGGLLPGQAACPHGVKIVKAVVHVVVLVRPGDPLQFVHQTHMCILLKIMTCLIP